MSLIYTHNSSPRRYKKVVKNKSYREAVEKQRQYLKSLGIDPDRKINRNEFRAYNDWWVTKEYQPTTKERKDVVEREPRLGNGGTKPNHNWRLEESQKFTVAPAYNKGAYQVITKSNIKDIGR
jgi:hypothetical protein|tara:strand:+ start:2107 stop:2475 length:369 start_codon:yes stop_codon:yes gene_type:complete